MGRCFLFVKNCRGCECVDEKDNDVFSIAAKRKENTKKIKEEAKDAVVVWSTKPGTRRRAPGPRRADSPAQNTHFGCQGTRHRHPARPQRRSLCLAPADILSTVANIPGIMLLRVCVLDTELGFGVPVRCLRRASEHPHGLDL
jgi:hypothetical protein